mmetsp:Transcript_51085/g.61533  ORF Transcript_51085/g.61533 Transcript_51085/m.61533 type:complete len:208 (-) Transcript_51085:633-1256(-)
MCHHVCRCVVILNAFVVVVGISGNSINISCGVMDIIRSAVSCHIVIIICCSYVAIFICRIAITCHHVIIFIQPVTFFDNCGDIFIIVCIQRRIRIFISYVVSINIVVKHCGFSMHFENCKITNKIEFLEERYCCINMLANAIGSGSGVVIHCHVMTCCHFANRVIVIRRRALCMSIIVIQGVIVVVISGFCHDAIVHRPIISIRGSV